MFMQIHEVIKTDVTAASDLTDACRAADQDLQKLARSVTEQQQALRICKVLVQPSAVPCKLCSTVQCLALRELMDPLCRNVPEWSPILFY